MNTFLEITKKGLGTLFAFEKIHVVIGNESCDLDSVISSLVYAYFIYQHQYLTTNTLAVPLLNINEDEYPLRTETKYFLSRHNICQLNLIFRNNIDLDKLYEEKKLILTLVDHHVLPEKDKKFSSIIQEIIDHRPVAKDVASARNLNINPVGSCCTLICQKIINTNSKILNAELAHLLHGTIILDTVNFNKDAKRFQKLDIMMAEYLEKNYSLTHTRDNIYKQLTKARSDISLLTPAQILHRDMKIVKEIPIPGVPMLFADYIKLPKAPEALEQLKNEYKAEIVIPMGLATYENIVYRDIGVYGNENKLKHELIKTLTGSELGLIYAETNVYNLSLFDQKNVKMSRKHILPIIESVIENCK